MPKYRIYLLSEMNQIIDAQNIDCEDDAAAVQRAREMVKRNVVEVWNGDRKVIRIELPKDSAPG